MKEKQKSRKFRLIKNILLFTVSVAAFFLIVEFYLSITMPDTKGWGEILEKSDNELLDTELRPNASILFEGLWAKLPVTEIKINSHGFRDYEYSVEKPRNTTRIICLGDSYSFGHGVNINETYAKVLERKLNAEKSSESTRYEVHNFGMPGYNTLQEIELLKTRALRFEPDIVTIYINGDDYRPPSWERVPPNSTTIKLSELLMRQKFHAAGWAGEQLWRYEETRLDKIDAEQNEAQENREKSRLRILSPLKELYNISTVHNFTVVIITHRDWPFFDDILNISSSKNWTLVELGKVNEEAGYSAGEEFRIVPKDNHPNATGHRVIGNALFSALTSVGT